MSAEREAEAGGWRHHCWPDADGYIHVWPQADLIEHEVAGEDCVCGPEVRLVVNKAGMDTWIVRHHSLDGRECLV